MPIGFLSSGVRHRALIRRLARARLAARYRGSVLGWLWMWLLPLFLLAVYTLVFGQVFQARWGGDDSTAFALVLFSGLLVYGLLADCLNEAPTLLASHQPYLKQVLFPTEILAWVVLAAALVRLGAGLILLIVARWIALGPPPLAVLWLPLTVLPVALLTLGGVWVLSSLGVFLRDLGHGISVFTSALLFLSPILYPASKVPDALRGWLWLNPLTPPLESTRRVLFDGAPPDLGPLSASLAAGWLLAWAGYAWFQRAKPGFADVL